MYLSVLSNAPEANSAELLELAAAWTLIWQGAGMACCSVSIAQCGFMHSSFVHLLKALYDFLCLNKLAVFFVDAIMSSCFD